MLVAAGVCGGSPRNEARMLLLRKRLIRLARLWYWGVPAARRPLGAVGAPAGVAGVAGGALTVVIWLTGMRSGRTCSKSMHCWPEPTDSQRGELCAAF